MNIIRYWAVHVKKSFCVGGRRRATVVAQAKKCKQITGFKHKLFRAIRIKTIARI